MVTDECRVKHFYVELGIFVLNHVFLCWTGHFRAEPGFFVSNECYDLIQHMEIWNMYGLCQYA